MSPGPCLRQLGEKRLGVFQIARVETFGEPAVHRSEQFARLLRIALRAPEAREAHCAAQFPELCLLFARDRESALKVGLSLRGVAAEQPQRDLSRYAIEFAISPYLIVDVACSCCFTDAPPSVIKKTKVGIRVRGDR